MFNQIIIVCGLLKNILISIRRIAIRESSREKVHSGHSGKGKGVGNERCKQTGMRQESRKKNWNERKEKKEKKRKTNWRSKCSTEIWEVVL